VILWQPRPWVHGVGADCSVAASPPEEGFCAFGPMADGADAPRQYGITKPLSLLGPVEADLQRTAELEKVRNCFQFRVTSVVWMLCLDGFTFSLLIEAVVTGYVIFPAQSDCSSWLRRAYMRAWKSLLSGRRCWGSLTR